MEFRISEFCKNILCPLESLIASYSSVLLSILNSPRRCIMSKNYVDISKKWIFKELNIAKNKISFLVFNLLEGFYWNLINILNGYRCVSWNSLLIFQNTGIFQDLTWYLTTVIRRFIFRIRVFKSALVLFRIGSSDASCTRWLCCTNRKESTTIVFLPNFEYSTGIF